MDTRVVVKQYVQRVLSQHKSKFQHYLYDLGLRNVIALTLYTFGICFSVLVPLTVPICALVFWLSVSELNDFCHQVLFLTFFVRI